MIQALRGHRFFSSIACAENRRSSIFFFLFLLIASITQPAAAQNGSNRVSGVVKGRANGQALSGVTVSVKGGRNATSTDNSGAFSINAPSGGTLVFSSVGYTDREVP